MYRFTGAVNNEQSVLMKFTNAPGKQCKVDLLTETCTAKASGRVPVIADGFVWFNYKDKVSLSSLHRSSRCSRQFIIACPKERSQGIETLQV